MKKYNELTKAEKEEIKVVVCDNCDMAACWHGELLCNEYVEAGVWAVPIYYLEQLGKENPCYWEHDTAGFYDRQKWTDSNK